MATVRNLRDATMEIHDGSGTPKVYTITISDGDVEWDEMRNAAILLNRGAIDSRKQGEDSPLPLKFSVLFEQWSYASGASTGLSIRDALTGEDGAAAASWVSTDACGPFAVDVVFKIQNPCTPAEHEILTFPKFHADKISFKEGKDANKLSVDGKCLATKPTRTYV